MDSNLIYAKTASGEEAMKKRTRVMQRNVRMVLILVRHGESTVADLCSNRQSAAHRIRLGRVGKGGFVEPRIVQDSFTAETAETAESTNLAYEILTAALDKSRQLSASGSTTGAEPSVPDVALPTDLELQTSVTPDSDASISRSAVASFESRTCPWSSLKRIMLLSLSGRNGRNIGDTTKELRGTQTVYCRSHPILFTECEFKF